MKTVIEFFKNHYGKIFFGTTGTILITAGGYLFSEIRYAKESDLKELKAQIVEIQEQLKK